jgi:hypothetical protein
MQVPVPNQVARLHPVGEHKTRRSWISVVGSHTAGPSLICICSKQKAWQQRRVPRRASQQARASSEDPPRWMPAPP